MLTSLPRYIFCCLFIFTFSLHSVIAIEDTSFLEDPEHLFWHDINDLPTIRMHFEEDQWALLLTSERNDREEVSATFTYIKQGQEYVLNNIGVKLSGNTSWTLPETSSDPFIQANYTLDFDEFVDDQTLSGISAMKLKRFKDDSTFAHEPLSNQIMLNFGVFTVHSSTYVRLELSVGERGTNYVGMYRLNESVNRHEYLDKRFGTDNDGGFLWQGNYKAHGPALFSRITSDWAGIGDFDEASFEYKGKSSKYEEGKAQLVELAQNFTQLQDADFEDYVEQHINMPLFLKGLASEAVIGHWDGFWGNANNYMFYIDENVVLHFIPFDTDNTMGTSLITEDSGEQNPFEFGQSSNTPLLISKVLAIPRFRQEYASYVWQLVTESNLMVENYAVDWITQAHLLIEDDLENITNDNEEIIDRPATWANQDSYRLFELETGKNWYATRKAAVDLAFTPPTANAGEDLTIEVGSTVQLDGSSSSDINGEIVAYQWSNGLTGATPSVTFDEVQTITITLTVTDNDGFTATDDMIITVVAPSPPPPATPPATQTSSSGGGSSHYSLLLLLFSVLLRNRTLQPQYQGHTSSSVQ